MTLTPSEYSFVHGSFIQAVKNTLDADADRIDLVSKMVAGELSVQERSLLAQWIVALYTSYEQPFVGGTL